MTDIRLQPEGRGAQVAKYIKDVLVEFGVAKTIRTCVTLTQLNAGLALLPALPGVRWRMIAASFIAIGGNAGGGTSANLQGTVAALTVQLWVVTIAALTRSTQVFTGVTPAAGAQTILADGASFTQQDANTALNVITVGSAMTTLTSLDVFLDYVADPA